MDAFEITICCFFLQEEAVDTKRVNKSTPIPIVVLFMVLTFAQRYNNSQKSTIFAP